MKKLALNIWWDARIVGQLTQNEHGELGFVYAADWIDDNATQPLSASLPKREKPYSRRECRPFFGGLLPEEGQRVAAAAALGVSKGNDFGLLDRLGGDVAGALQLLPIGEEPRDPRPRQQSTLLDDAGLIRVLDALPGRPLLAGENGLRLSLAGAQAKVPVVLVNGVVALPAPGQPTTHIVKPPIPRFPATTENEAFVMRLAAAVGLDVAAAEPRIVGDRSYLLIERYDREFLEDGTVRRLQQEDFCQALGIAPEKKYAGEGGPAFYHCFKLLRDVVSRPAGDVMKLLDAAIFNLIAGNADAHGKNFSILYGRRGPQLAPLYDLLSTVAYPHISAKLAMKIGKRATLEEMDEKGWFAFADEAGIGFPLVKQRIEQISQGVIDQANEVANEIALPGLDQAALSRFAEAVGGRAMQVRKTLGSGIKI